MTNEKKTNAKKSYHIVFIYKCFINAMVFRSRINTNFVNNRKLIQNQPGNYPSLFSGLRGILVSLLLHYKTSMII